MAEIKSAGEILGTTPITTQKVDCKKHGEYEQTVCTWFGGRPIYNVCPYCEQESSEKIRAEYAERDRQREREEGARRLAELEEKGIRRRFYSTTFETFSAGTESQKKALERCRAFVAEKAANKETGKALFLLGRPGTGKNHLAVSIVREWGENAIIKKASEIIREVRSTYGTGGSEQGEIERFAWFDLLVINEVGIQFGTEAEKNLLFEILDIRYESMRPTVFISNLNLAGVREFIGGRVIDRMMECGEVIEFLWDSYRGKNG